MASAGDVLAGLGRSYLFEDLTAEQLGYLAVRRDDSCFGAGRVLVFFDYEKDGHHVSDGDNAIYFRPETGNHILIGSEDPDCDPQVWVENPDEFNRQITREQWEAQVYRCARRIPTLPIPEEMKGVVDLYDCSDDWIPIYDKSDLGGFYMAVGTSGNQFKNGPVVGHCMAELIDAVEKGHDHDSDPVKVTTRYTGGCSTCRSTRGCATSTRTARSRSMANVAPWLHVRLGAEAVEYYTAAFGAVELHRHSNESGEIVAQLSVDGEEFWVADDADHSPDFLGGGSARFILSVDDPDAVFAQAIAAGGTVVNDMYEGHGWRIGRLTDPFGHDWEVGKPFRSRRARAVRARAHPRAGDVEQNASAASRWSSRGSTRSRPSDR